MHAICERVLHSDRRRNEPVNYPKSIPTEADESQLRETQLPNAFYRLTPELSRPVAGWRTRASVAQARGRRHDAGSA